PAITPITTMAMDLIADPVVNVEAANKPNNIKEKYSAGPNLKAKFTNTGPKPDINIMPIVEPIKEANMAINNAEPARPCLARGCPSKLTTACDAVPGRLSKMVVIAPP